jgi:hypothetical protein
MKAKGKDDSVEGKALKARSKTKALKSKASKAKAFLDTEYFLLLFVE